MSTRIFILPLWIRLWHWTNALLIIILTISGASLHFANPELILVPFALAARIHDFAGLALIAAYSFFAVANVISGNWWQYVPKPEGFIKKCVRQTRFYAWGIFHGEPPPYPPTPKNNFNAMQQIVYWFMMYLVMPILLVTGVMFMWPDLAPKSVFGYDGLMPVAVLHYLSALVIVSFMFAHIYLGTTGHKISTHFKMMITGWHEH